MTALIFDRRARVTVNGLSVDGLRVRFQIQKDLTRAPNQCEVSIYNLARGTRERFHHDRKVPVVVEAGYRDTGLSVLFAGEMREAFSRADPDGSWVTVLRAGDGDDALRQRRGAKKLAKGISFERVVGEVADSMKVGAGNMWQALKDGKPAGDVFKMGYNAVGSLSSQFEKLMKSAELEYSVQDQQIQILPVGKTLSTTAVVLTPSTGLEGSPEIDVHGTMSVRARLMPGLAPGYPLQVSAVKPVTLETGWYAFQVVEDSTIYRIEKTRYAGDTHGDDWTASIECRDVALGPYVPPKVSTK